MKFKNGNNEIKVMPNGTRWVDISEIKHVMTSKKQGYSEEEVLELLLKSKIETSNLYYEDIKEWFELNKKK